MKGGERGGEGGGEGGGGKEGEMLKTYELEETRPLSLQFTIHRRRWCENSPPVPGKVWSPQSEIKHCPSAPSLLSFVFLKH